MPLLDCKIKTDLKRNATMFDLGDHMVTDLWGGDGWWVITDTSTINKARHLHHLGNEEKIDIFWHRLRRDGPKGIATFQPKAKPLPIMEPITEEAEMALPRPATFTAFYAFFWTIGALALLNLIRHIFITD